MKIRTSILFSLVIYLAVCLRQSLIHAQLTSIEVGRPEGRTPLVRTNVTMYAWSSWGPWSACSRTCGGGVAVQERQCLPRDPARLRRSRKRRKLVRSTERVRKTRMVPPNEPDCPGLGRRYHECNTAPCPGPPRDPRAEQCAIYDRRPFRGRFYTWVPYVDGNAPCTLNCRPRGQQFYASLALVSDGTPCTKPGFRAICVQGSCMLHLATVIPIDSWLNKVRLHIEEKPSKSHERVIEYQENAMKSALECEHEIFLGKSRARAVGREGVLASTTMREVKCGRRLVSGLFSRPRLPLGYSYVTTVPRGACQLNVSEIISSENYIALKVTNGSYIMNGEFAVSAPGTYEAAGARFMYSRPGGVDSVFAVGPIHHPIDIMILYTQPNPSIKYEYLTDSETDDTSNDIPTSNNIPQHEHSPRHHRHHNTYHMKALDHQKDPSLPFFTFQDSTKKPSEPNYNKVLERKWQEENNATGYRKFVWKILSFTPCSRTCGGGLQVGKFKCVEVSSGEDREVSPANCEGSPPTSRRRRCGGAPCPPRWRAAAWGPCPVCGPAHRTRIVGCVQDHARGITKISDQKCPLPMPPSSEPCDIPNCDGTPVTTVSPRLDARRQVRPKDRTDAFREGPIFSLGSNITENEISPTLGPAYSFSAAGGWLYTDWSECVGWCIGGGVQSRGVRCADPSGCSPHRAPVASQSCPIKKQCDAQWFTGDWSPCSTSCGGRQVRGVICIGGNGRRLRDMACQQPKPDTERACGVKCSPSWYLSDWGECQGPCETGIQTRTVWCARGGVEGAAGAAKDHECPGLRPLARRSCVPPRCSSRPAIKPSVISVPSAVSDQQQRVTRHQNHNTQNVRDRPVSDAACMDKLTTCSLAVQARLCHYPYYAEFCCRSCRGR